MNLNKVAGMLAAYEGKKKSLDIAQIKEVIKCISMLMVQFPEITAHLIENGYKNLKKKREIK